MRSNQTLQDTYRKLRGSQYCLACSRFHDEGSVMHYSVAMVNGSFQHGYFCTAMDCTNYISEDKPGGVPHSRWVLTELLGRPIVFIDVGKDVAFPFTLGVYTDA